MEVELKTAVVTALDAVLSIDIHNGAGLNEARPYVDLDDYEEYDWSTKSFTGTEGRLKLHVWSKDRDQVATVMKTIRATLDRADLTISGQNYVDCQFYDSRSFTDADGITRHGVIEFRVLAHS